MESPHVVVLFNEPVLPADHADSAAEREVLDTVEHVSRALNEADFRVFRLGAGRDPAAFITALRFLQPADVVFNLFEGSGDKESTEATVAGLLDWLGVPFTGCPAQALSLARNKQLTKHLLKGAGLPTPEFFVVDGPPVPPCELRWPVIVKPALYDAGIGLDQGSVVTDQAALDQRVDFLLDRYGPPVLVEEFIRGRELNVSLVEVPELRCLPVSEVLFLDPDPAHWPIVTYDAKWRPDSRDFAATPARYPAEVAPELAGRLHDLARRAYRLLGCRDYARVDFRVAPDGGAYVLEVNPNPAFAPDAGLAGGLRSAGITHEQFTVDLARNALARGEKLSQNA
jgi:D-alanine-D-alanine ligase